MDELIGKIIVICVIWGVISCIGFGLLTGIVGVVLTGAVVNT